MLRMRIFSPHTALPLSHLPSAVGEAELAAAESPSCLLFEVRRSQGQGSLADEHRLPPPPQEAKQSWKLHRAALLARIDRAAMTAAGQRNPRNRFWQTDDAASDGHPKG
jgi:hypothetical protein